MRVNGNAQAIGRVIRNLVDNANRYTPPNTTVDVVVEPGEPATVRVVDRGPGFPAEFSAHAFERSPAPIRAAPVRPEVPASGW